MAATDPENCSELCGFGECPPPGKLFIAATLVPWAGHSDGCDGVEIPPPLNDFQPAAFTWNAATSGWETPNPTPGQSQFRLYCNDPGSGIGCCPMMDVLDDQGAVVASYPLALQGNNLVGAAAGYCRIGFTFRCVQPPVEGD